MPRDVQQNKLYKTERIWFNNYPNNPKDVFLDTERKASNYATWIWINFKKKIYPESWRTRVPRVRVSFKGRTWSYAMNSGGWYNDRKTNAKYKWIKLAPCHQTFRIIIHEMAHHIAPERVSHGPEFVKVYMFLLAYYLDYDLSYMCKIANERNLQFSSTDKYLNTNFNKLLEKQKKNWIETEANKLKGVA